MGKEARRLFFHELIGLGMGLAFCATAPAAATAMDPRWVPFPDITDAPGELFFNEDATIVTGDNQIQGAALYDDLYILTGGNNGTDPNKVYLVNNNGVLADSFDQHATTGIGWLDLAQDNDLLYSSAGPDIDKFTVNGNPEGSFAGPLSINRALAFDQDQGALWIADLDSDIYKFSESEGIINQYPNDKQITGLAWEKTSEGVPLLWVLAQSPIGIYQFDPAAGEYTGISYPAAWITGAPGGIEFFTTVTGPGQTFRGLLLGINQDDPDTIFAMELFSCEDGCYIGGTCHPDGETNPDEDCQFCDIQQTMSAWSFQENGANCNDGSWCTEQDACSSGICEGIQRDCDDGEFCTGVESCDDEQQQCVSPGDPCADDQTCDEQADICDDADNDDDDDDDDDDSGCCG